MPNIEVKTKVVKLGDNLAIPLPKEFSESAPIKEGSELTIIYRYKSNFEVKIENLTGQIKCQICNKGTGKYTCTQCGVVACSNCFWEWGNMCNKCIKRGKK